MPLVRVERRGRCAWVTLDRPPLNLFTLELIAAVRETFDTLAGPKRRLPEVAGEVLKLARAAVGRQTP